MKELYKDCQYKEIAAIRKDGAIPPFGVRVGVIMSAVAALLL